MKIFIQFGNKGSSVTDHLIRPLSGVSALTSILLVCRYPGPKIPKVEYHCPPRFIARFASASVIYEFIDLFYLATFGGPGYIAGYLLNPHGLIAFIVAKLTRKPVIVSLIAGPFELYSRRKPLGVNFSKPLPWSGRLLLKMVNKSNAVITTGSFTKNFLSIHGVKESKICPMINPPNKSRFKVLDVNKIYDVVSIGRLVPVKHNEVMIRAIPKVKERFANIKVCIVGDGPCKPDLVRLVSALGVQNNVDFVGFQENTPYFYNRSKIFILSSEREGFPNVILEAMLCGLPSVVSNCGDITDIAKDGHNSIVIQDFNDAEGFARAIISLLENEKLYNKISQEALKTGESLSAGDLTNTWNVLLQKIQSHE